MYPMSNSVQSEIAVIGAGPAGLFAARELAQAGCKVALLNRDIKPGGLAEYGIYPDKLKMKEGLRSQFKQILASPGITYYGNIRIGEQEDIRIIDFLDAGFDAVLVCIGAQNNRSLNLPGENLEGVLHANQLVYHYTQMPPNSMDPCEIGNKVVVVGAGNVMTDITCYLIRKQKVEQVTVVARRGPMEVKFEKKEFERIAANLDMDDLDQQLNALEPLLKSLRQDPACARELFYACLPKADPKNSDTRFYVRFLASPTRFIGDANGKLVGIELQKNTLHLKNGKPQAQAIDETLCLEADTVVLAIGNQVDEGLGLPVIKGEFAKNPNPAYPVEGNSFEAFDPEKGQVIESIFLAGWARKASEGLVGQARKDGINGARAVIQYLSQRQPNNKHSLAWLENQVAQLPHPVVRLENLALLEKAERARAIESGQVEFSFATNDQMLFSMGLIKENPGQSQPAKS